MELNTVVSEIKGKVGIITLNRPKALNAVSEEMLRELTSQTKAFDEDPWVRAIIIRGSDKAFAAGIDVRDLIEKVNSRDTELLKMHKYMETFCRYAQTADCRRRRFCIGNRVRNRAELRHHSGCGQRQIRPAGTEPGLHSLFRCHSAADQSNRKGQSNGSDSQRTGNQRGRGRTDGTRQPDYSSDGFIRRMLQSRRQNRRTIGFGGQPPPNPGH